MTTSIRESHDISHGVLPYAPVQPGVSLVLTRFRLRSPIWLPMFYVAFRQVHKEAREKIPGLLKAVFLVESPTVCYTMSLWANDDAILQFGTLVVKHIHAANWSFPRLRRLTTNEPELFSAHWSLAGISNNLNWEGLELPVALRGTH